MPSKKPQIPEHPGTWLAQEKDGSWILIVMLGANTREEVKDVIETFCDNKKSRKLMSGYATAYIVNF